MRRDANLSRLGAFGCSATFPSACLLAGKQPKMIARFLRIFLFARPALLSRSLFAIPMERTQKVVQVGSALIRKELPRNRSPGPSYAHSCWFGLWRVDDCGSVWDGSVGSPDLVSQGRKLRFEGSCAGTHPELESELRARLVLWMSSAAYPRGR